MEALVGGAGVARGGSTQELLGWVWLARSAWRMVFAIGWRFGRACYSGARLPQSHDLPGMRH